MKEKSYWWEDRLRKIAHNIETKQPYANYSELVLYVAKIIEAEKEKTINEIKNKNGGNKQTGSIS